MAQRQAVNSLMLATLRQIVATNEAAIREAMLRQKRFSNAPLGLANTKMGLLLGAMRPGVRYTPDMIRAIAPEDWGARVAANTCYSLYRLGYVKKGGHGRASAWYMRGA